MGIGRDNAQPRTHIVADSRAPQQWQQQKGQQGRRQHIDGDCSLVAVDDTRKDRGGDAGVLEDGVEAVQLGDGTAGKSDDAGKRGQINRPDIDDTGRAGGGQRCADVGCGRLALFGRAAGQDDAGSAQTSRMAGCFEAETTVGASDENCLAGQAARRRERDGMQLGPQEVGGKGNEAAGQPRVLCGKETTHVFRSSMVV